MVASEQTMMVPEIEKVNSPALSTEATGLPLCQGPTAAEAETAPDKSDTESIGNQRNLLSKKRLLVAFPALSLALFVSFMDQTSVSVSIPSISKDLDTGAATAWIGASFLIASTAFQLVNGRLSDIFGRKNMLLICLGLIGLGDLLAGFAQSKEQLFVFRGIAGIGGGGINSIVMIIVSDVTTLANRGKYQGILGAVLALANGTGPFIGGALVEKATWRWVFWIVPLLAIPAALTILLFLPLTHDRGNYAAKFKKVDFGGIVLNLAAVLLILIPVSGGGVTYAWSSAPFISMLTVGLVLVVAFLFYEWKIAPIPIMPLRLLTAAHCSYMYAQSFFSGLVFYGNFFYMPIYFQSVLQYSPLQSGALILPLIITTSIFSVVSGQFMARVYLYMPCIVTGYALWTIGTGLKSTFTQTTALWKIIVILAVEGVGVGLTLQPTLVGLLANSRSEDRAVLTGLRNLIRTVGGGFGLIASGAILSNTLSSRLSGFPFITDDMVKSLTSSAYALEQFGLASDEKKEILGVYMQGVHYIFVFYAACTGCNFLLSIGVGNTRLKGAKKDTTPASRDIEGLGGRDTKGDTNAGQHIDSEGKGER